MRPSYWYFSLVAEASQVAPLSTDGRQRGTFLAFCELPVSHISPAPPRLVSRTGSL
jgi:hypothetical protein